MILEIQFRLKNISPVSILNINALCQILLDKAGQAPQIQKHKCLRTDVRCCVGLWVFERCFCVHKRQTTEHWERSQIRG